MSKLHWEKLHDWWVADLRFWLEQKWFFVLLIRKHPGDIAYINTVKSLEKCLEQSQKEYKKIYGVRMNLREIRKEVEK